MYELGPETYAPALAAILPVGGIIGGVGGGLMGDWLSRRGGLSLLTAGAPCWPPCVLRSDLVMHGHTTLLTWLLKLDAESLICSGYMMSLSLQLVRFRSVPVRAANPPKHRGASTADAAPDPLIALS